MILFCICTPIYICSWYFTYILLHFLIRKKNCTNINYFKYLLNDTILQDKCFCTINCAFTRRSIWNNETEWMSFFSYPIHSFIQTCNLFPSVFCQNISKIIATQQFYLTMWCEVLTYRVSKFVAQKVFNTALLYSTMNVTKTVTNNDFNNESNKSF